MSGPFGSSQWMYNPSAGFYGTEIDNSLRFNDDDNANLSRTFGSTSNRATWTWSGWVKRGNLGVDQSIFGTQSGGSNIGYIAFDSNNKLDLNNKLNDSTGVEGNSTRLFRDVGAWYHLVIVFDGNQSNQSDRFSIYVNGESDTFVPRGSKSAGNGYINTAVIHGIGYRAQENNWYYDGYMADINFIDGQALDATSFGETKSGIWIPKEYSGSYGTNGFHLEFAGNANDTSGNGNNFTANNISAYDYVPDSPTNNFATFSPLAQFRSGTSFFGKGTLSEGNLLTTNNTDNEGSVIPFGPASGKWYVEFCAKNLAQRQTVTAFGNDGFNFASTFVSSRSDAGGNATGDQSWTTGDIIGVAYDFDNGKVWFAKNNTWYNSSDPATNTGGDSMSALYGFSVHQVSTSTSNATIVFNAGQDSSFTGAKTAQGNTDANGVGDFYYTPPSGFLALCSANLPAPTFDPADDVTPEDYFNTVTWTGNGSTSGNAITGVGFQPEFVWLKQRNGTASHLVHDIVRGTQTGGYIPLNPSANNLESDYGSAFLTAYGAITSLDSDGFTVVDGNLSTDNYNGSSDTYVAWNWKAGGTAVSNTDGSITSTVSANTDAGFSIATYTGNATAGATVGHGLGVAPDVVLIKARARSGGSDWPMYHRGIPNSETGWIRLNLSNAWSSTSILWNNTAPSSSVVTLGSYDYVNDSGTSHVMYSFASKEGYSKFGSYTGNGSSDGPFIFTGFRPAWVMIKYYSGSGQEWCIQDNRRIGYNPDNAALFADLSSAEYASNLRYIDFTSNGFKLRNTTTNQNVSGGNYIYMAFAEQPFKYANAR